MKFSKKFPAVNISTLCANFGWGIVWENWRFGEEFHNFIGAKRRQNQRIFFKMRRFFKIGE